MPPRRTQAERSAGTTTDLIARATACFGADGYDRVSLDGVAEAAGVTKGAVYHHFGGKRELFLAVYTDAHQRIAARVTAAVADAPTGWDRLETGAAAFLAACAEPDLQRIVVIDGPRVLDRGTIREIEDRHAAGLLRSALARLRQIGEAKPGDDSLRTRLLLGALCEAASAVVESPQPADALARARGEIGCLLSGLRV